MDCKTRSTSTYHRVTQCETVSKRDTVAETVSTRDTVAETVPKRDTETVQRVKQSVRQI